MNKCEKLESLKNEIKRLKKIIEDGFLVTYDCLETTNIEGLFKCKYNTYRCGEKLK